MRNWTARVLTAALLATGAAGLFAADDKKPAPKQQEQKAAKVKDIMCGMEVDPKTAEKSTYNGKTYYFCSRGEKVEFDKNPSKYAK
jgi:YHS domain-containing protein